MSDSIQICRKGELDRHGSRAGQLALVAPGNWRAKHREWQSILECQKQNQKQNQRAYATQEAAASVVCGGVAGSAFWLAVLPIDLAKTRYQIASPGAADDVGVWRLMARETSRTGARGLWVGVGPVLARAFPANAVQFLAWEGACQLAGVRREHGR